MAQSVFLTYSQRMAATSSAPLTESHAHGPTDPPVRDITLGDLLTEAASNAPDRVALIAGVANVADRRQWTYAELLQECTTVARALLSRFAPGDKIAIWAPNLPEWVMLEFGAAMAGMIVVTVNPAFQANELEYVLTQSQSSGLFVINDFRGNPMKATAEATQPACPDLHTIIGFDEWDDFLAGANNFTGTLPDVKPTDPVMIQYTSGTTGFPKGALLHHRGLVNNGAHTAAQTGVEEGDVWITTMPLFHTGGCVCCVLGSVSVQATQVLVEAFDPGLVLELFETYKGNTMVGVPTMLIAMLEHPEFADRDVSSIKSVASGGSTVPAPLVRRFEEELQSPFIIVFGQTECSPVASMTLPTDSIDDKANTIGPPMPNVEVKIIDPETGATLPVGEQGEFLTRGYHVMHGYYRNDEATAKAIDADGWLHTGDLCSMDDRGYCAVEGRLTDMIIRGGENIYPKELENLLFNHDSVAEVAVVGLPDEKFGETVGAFIRPADGHSVNKTELFDYLREHLSKHKTPKQWFSVDAFPLTGSGKIQKFKLLEQWKSGEQSEL